MIFKVQGLQNRTPNRSTIGSTSHLRRGGLQKASGEALGALLGASGAKIKKLGTALGRVGPKKGGHNGSQHVSQKRSKMPLGAQGAPRGCQGAMLDQFWSQLGSIPARFWDVFCVMSDSLQPRIHSWESDIKGHKLQFVLSISSLAIRSLLSRDAVCEVAGFGGAAPCEIRPPSFSSEAAAV